MKKLTKPPAATQIVLSEDWNTKVQQLAKLRQEEKFPAFLLLRGYEDEKLRQLTKRLVQILLCDNKTGCSICSSCQKVLSEQHEEWLMLDAFAESAETSGSYRLESANAIKEHLTLHGLAGGSRVVSLFEAAALNTQAVNRLLKTLEEIPKDAFVIMTTTRPLEILETLRGRAVSWVFRPEKCTLSAADLLGNEEKLEIKKILLGDLPLGERLQAAERVAKVKTLTFSELLDGIELLFHEDLSTRANHPSHNWDGVRRARVREELSQLRRLGVRGKISLNMQLALESLAAHSSGL